MKRIVIIVSLFVLTNNSYTQITPIETTTQTTQTSSESYKDFFKEYDFDSMADEMTEVGYQVSVKPPSTFMYWVRKIGTPIFMKYLDAVEFLKKKIARAKEYRERWSKAIATYIQVRRRMPGQPRGSSGLGLGLGADGAVRVYIS